MAEDWELQKIKAELRKEKNIFVSFLIVCKESWIPLLLLAAILGACAYFSINKTHYQWWLPGIKDNVRHY